MSLHHRGGDGRDGVSKSSQAGQLNYSCIDASNINLVARGRFLITYSGKHCAALVFFSLREQRDVLCVLKKR